MPPRGRPRKGNRRIDAAIDHFAPMGYSIADIRAVVKELLKVYGDEGWLFLEEGVYCVVQEALFEKQEQEDKLRLQLPQEEEMEGEDQQPQLHLEGAMDDTPLENSMSIVALHNEQLNGAMDDAPLENSMSIIAVHNEKLEGAMDDASLQNSMSIIAVHNEQLEGEMDDASMQNSMSIIAVHNEQLEGTMDDAPLENSMSIVAVHNEVTSEVESVADSPAVETILPLPKAAVTSAPRRPFYGWISESETESESENEDQPASAQSELCKRNRSRYEAS